MIRFLIVAAGVVIAASTPANADPLHQDLVLRTYHPARIALPDFVASGLSEAEPAHLISRIVTSDLTQSRAFAPINQKVFAEKNVSVDEAPNFADWRAINAEELVVGRLTRQPDGRFKVEFRLWDIFSGQQLFGQQYTATPDGFNRIGHMISEQIYEQLTGKKRTFE